MENENGLLSDDENTEIGGDSSPTSSVSDDDTEKESKNGSRIQTIYILFKQWTYSVAVGTLVVTFWRGAWTLIDIYSCQSTGSATLLNGEVFCFSFDVQSSMRRNSALASLGIGYLLTMSGKLLYSRGWFNGIDKSEGGTTTMAKRSLTAFRRVTNLQTMALGGVLIWRGLWYLSDNLLYPDNVLMSSWLTGLLGCLGSISLCCSPSLCGSPSVSPFRDPCNVPFGTIGSAISNQVSLLKDSTNSSCDSGLSWRVADTIFTYIFLPLFELWFYRGIWLLEDFYFWGFTASSSDLNFSIWMSAAIFVVCVGLNAFIDNNVKLFVVLRSKSGLASFHFARQLQYVVLGIASVSFWRFVWYTLEVLLIPDYLSCWISFIFSWMLLVSFSAFANVIFPAVPDISSLSDILIDDHEDLAGDDARSSFRWFGIIS